MGINNEVPVTLSVIRDNFPGCEVSRTKRGIEVVDRRLLGQNLKLIFRKGDMVPVELLSQQLELEIEYGEPWALHGITVKCPMWVGLYCGSYGSKGHYLEPLLLSDERVNAMALSVNLSAMEADNVVIPKEAIGHWRISRSNGTTLVLLVPLSERDRIGLCNLFGY